MGDVLDLLRKNPILIEINNKYVRDGAYYAALDERKKRSDEV
jgi:hypothetical protein